MMHSFLAKCVFLLFAAVPVFSQSGAVREQGLITSEPFWRQALGGAVLSLPHFQAGSAVVALDGGNIRAYSTAGTPMWNYSARGRISPFVTRSREGTSYFSRTNGALIAVNRAGRELWRRNLGEPLCARVVTGWDGRLFVPAGRKIFCYTASGNLLWTKEFESPFSTAPKLDRGGGIILALENNEAYHVDAFGNTHVWFLSNTPAVLLSIERQRIIALYMDGTMEILGSAEDWYISAQSEVHSSLLPRLPSGPLAAVNRGNNIAVTLNDGRITLVSMDERRILWTGDSHIKEMINSGGRPETEVEMLFDERGIYILNKNGATGFSHDGRRLWFTFLQNAAAVPAFGDDGVLYSGGRDWILYAYRIEDRALPARNTIYGPVPEGSYRTGQPQSTYAEYFPLNEHGTREKLEQIGAAVTAGRIGSNEPAWMSFLLTLSAGQENIIFRIGALNLLGKIGSRETIPWLISVFLRDNEPAIKTAAVTAVGDIGVDPEGVAIHTFLYSIIQGGGIRDEQVLTAIASATGALCRFSGPPLSETGIRILNLLSVASQPPIVRRQANRELASLR
jgi:outer membrane protein assembly factor BamB